MTKDDIRVYEERTRVLLEQLRQSDATPDVGAEEAMAEDSSATQELSADASSITQPVTKSCW